MRRAGGAWFDCAHHRRPALSQSPKTNEAGGGGVWISEGAERPHFKENCHHEKIWNCLRCACDHFDHLRRRACTKTRPQACTCDASTRPFETQYRKSAATGADDEHSAERAGNIAVEGCGRFSAIAAWSGERTAAIVAGAPDYACAALPNGASPDPAAWQSAEFGREPCASGDTGDTDSRVAAADGTDAASFSLSIHGHSRR